MTHRLTNSIFAFLLSFQFALHAQEAPPEFKAGIVNVQQVFKSYYRTAETQIDIDQERARIKKVDSEALAKLRTLQQRLQDLYQQSRVEDISDEARAALIQEQEKLRQHSKRLDDERAARFKQANANLDQQMKGKMKGILDEISELVRQHAEKEGFTIVFEKAGTNTNQVTPLLFGKDLIDITAVLMKELNKDGPDDE